MKNDLAYRRMRLAEVEQPAESETVVHGRCRSVIRGEIAERVKLRAFLNDLHNRSLSNTRGEIR
jgi:hypothetical protein